MATNEKINLVYGVGINDADYIVQPTINGNKKSCLFYRTWHNMLRRCYHYESYKNYPTYADCIVCNEWHSFMTFRAWMINQDFEGKQLDKDLLFSGNKIYSPETCIFISKKINVLLAKKPINGTQPLGVYRIKDRNTNKYTARISTGTGYKYLGCFLTESDAHKAYLKFKISLFINIANENDDIRIKNSMLRIAEEMKAELI